jgi:hypothetical protein
MAALTLANAAGASVALARTPGGPARERSQSCQKIVLNGEVRAGAEWRAAFGQGWVFRVLPIHAGSAGGAVFGGWDLVVDRSRSKGYPDALLLATPPYNSINEHEVGTTYGLRAQDAIGWNPRSFRFMTDPAAFREAQKLFLSLSRAGWARPAPPGSRKGTETRSQMESSELQKLIQLTAQSSAGEFRILNVRLTPGTGDAAPYAENWALQSGNTPHTDVPAPGGLSTPRGEIEWIQFSVTLWLPAGWKAAKELHAVQARCSE